MPSTIIAPITDHEPALAALVSALRLRFPDALAIYLFGSCATRDAGPESDLDLAILLPRRADALAIWDGSTELARIARRDVDLVDLRSATTVMQYQVITTGQRLWQLDLQAGLFEAAVLSEKTALDEARAALLGDIVREGHVHGR